MLERLKSKQGAVGVVGLGYVGLPLLLAYAKAGFRAVGIDIDPAKPAALLAGRSYIKHIPSEEVAAALASGKLEATTDFAIISTLDAIILCVPTPLDQHFEPDLSYVTVTVDSVVPHLKAGQVLSLESTTYPGTTDEEVVTRVEKAGFTVGTDLHVVYSPEREDPGNDLSKVKVVPKVIGGLTPACLAKAQAVYSRAIDTLVPVSSCRVAEATKLLENIFRSVNIALVNELKVVYEAMGIDVWEVINAAKTKPFGFMAFYPGPGLGGHCIPIDPFYLTWKAREFGQNTRFIELAGEINTRMPEHVVHRVADALNNHGKAVKGSRILILGLAYKPNVDDERESPSYLLMDLLNDRGAQLEYHDPYVPVIRPTREHPQYAGIASVPWNQETVSSFDVVLISTNHACVNYEELAAWAPCIVDTRNAMASVPTAAGQVMKA